MTQLRETLHSAFAALRPPAAGVRRKGSSVTHALPAVVSIAKPAALGSIAARLLVAGSTQLILPAAGLAARSPASSFTRALTRAVASRGPVAVGARGEAGWARVAPDLGARYVALGSDGWARIELDVHALLDAVYLPLEVERADFVLAVAAGDAGVLGFWDHVVHPHSALQARVGGDRARMDLVAAAAATYVFTLGPRAAPLIAWADDPVAAELTLLAARYLADEQDGYEQRLPWEDARVQAAVERGLGVASHHDVRICAQLEPTAAGAFAYTQALARVLGCEHLLVNSGE
jgi:hypothetical protein